MGIAMPCSRPAPRQVILVADDEPLIRAFLCDWLNENGFATAEAADGNQAIARLLRDRDIALVFSDVGMPGCDGITLAAWMRDNRPEIPVILASAETMPGASMPGVNFLAKPYDLTAVVQCIARELQRKTANAAAQALCSA